VEADEAGLVVEWLEDRHRGHRGAIRVGDNAFGDVEEVVTVDFRDHERHIRVLAPGA
jgi:hypothetical protein